MMTSGPSAPDPIYTLRGAADTVTALKVGIINYQSLVITLSLHM